MDQGDRDGCSSAVTTSTILSSLRGTLYTGLTDDLKKRIMEHKDGTFDGFTKKYDINRLMYFETYSEPRVAAARELQIKKFRREKKIALFAESNPHWKDLTPEIFAAIGILPLRVGISEKSAS